MTDTTDYTIAAQTEQGAVIIAEVTHADLTERDTTGHGTIEHIERSSKSTRHSWPASENSECWNPSSADAARTAP